MGSFLTARWEHLLNITFQVAPEIIARELPPGLEPDCWNGSALLSLVGFRFRDLRVLGLKPPGTADFAQLNLRTYVRRSGERGVMGGVYFLKELCPLRLVTLGASTLYHESYSTLPVGYRWDTVSGEIAYSVLDGPELTHMRGFVGGALPRPGCSLPEFSLPSAGSLEHFLADRYRGFCAMPFRRTAEFSVTRREWRCAPVRDVSISLETERLYGQTLGRVLRAPPVSAMLCDGSAVSVSWRRTITPLRAPEASPESGEHRPLHPDRSAAAHTPAPPFAAATAGR